MTAAMDARAWASLCDAAGRAADSGALFAAIDAAREALLGAGLLTVSAYDAERSRLQRVWSSDPSAYPVGGTKDKADSQWTRQVLRRAEPFVGEGDAAIAEAFDDHERIRGLGMHAVVNVPLAWQGRCIATFNVLGRDARWAPDSVTCIRLLAQWAWPAVLAMRGA